MNKNKRIAILKRLRESDGQHRFFEMNFMSPFEVLISVILSAKTKDISVKKVITNLFTVANTPQKILDLGFEKLKFYIKAVGLFNNKAKNIIKTCYILLKENEGKVPENQEKLEALPGVGSKTANVVLNLAFGWPTIAVDTHVFRVCNRTNFALGNSVKEVEKKLIKSVPAGFKVNCHQLLLLHGRHICMARKPCCKYCVIEDLCEFKEKIYS